MDASSAGGAGVTLSLATGLLLGARHALEPDHLAAVSILITRRASPQAGAALGAWWGLGHALALLAVGSTLAALDSHLPPSIAGGFELLVALMLLALGARAVLRAIRGRADRSAAGHHHPGRWALARRPILVGLVHGLAGSGALTALALTSLPTFGARLLGGDRPVLDPAWTAVGLVGAAGTPPPLRSGALRSLAAVKVAPGARRAGARRRPAAISAPDRS
jgi:hypothetical protein